MAVRTALNLRNVFVASGVALAWTASAFAAAPATAPAADPDWHIPLADPATTQSAPDFTRLQAARDALAAVVSAGGWPPLPGGTALALGYRGPGVPALRDRLRLGGDFDAEVQADVWFFDANLETALRRFQSRHGIAESGVLDERTLEALNVPAEYRLSQLQASLERWRWLPRQFESRYVWANLPAATLEVREGDRVVLTMKTIIGHPDRSTPSFRGRLGPVTIHPTWFVPRRVAVEDLLPTQQADPNFFDEHGIRVYSGDRQVPASSVRWDRLGRQNFPYRLVQDAGPGNSLGRVKIAAGNPYDIYLHDTPADLWALSYRTLGSGCIRLEQPFALVDFLLAADRPWTPADTKAALARADTQVYPLKREVPVYAVYLTAWVTPDGLVHFRRDIYGRDARLLRALPTAGIMPGFPGGSRWQNRPLAPPPAAPRSASRTAS